MGGSDLYRIDADGSPHKIWSNSQDIVYAIGFDAKGACYVKLPLVPKGQEANIRKLLDAAAKAHPYLGAIQQR